MGYCMLSDVVVVAVVPADDTRLYFKKEMVWHTEAPDWPVTVIFPSEMTRVALYTHPGLQGHATTPSTIKCAAACSPTWSLLQLSQPP